jgi:4-hydroxy-2-oxoheptanedioate aldolase
MMRPNKVKARLRAKTPAVGCWLSLGAPAVTEVLAGAGFDAFLVDQEHGEGTLTDGVAQLRAASAYDTSLLIRVPSHDPNHIKRVLDAGFEGVMVPGIESAQQAKAIVDACRYPPHGRRGTAGTIRAGDYGRRWNDYLARHVDELLVIVQIESALAVERVPEIAAVAGVDVLFIGPLDLSASIGKTGKFDDPEVAALHDRAERTIKASGKWLGGLELGGGADRLLARGYDLVFATSDLNLLRDGAVKALEACGRRR